VTDTCAYVFYEAAVLGREPNPEHPERGPMRLPFGRCVRLHLGAPVVVPPPPLGGGNQYTQFSGYHCPQAVILPRPPSGEGVTDSRDEDTRSGHVAGSGRVGL